MSMAIFNSYVDITRGYVGWFLRNSTNQALCFFFRQRVSKIWLWSGMKDSFLNSYEELGQSYPWRIHGAAIYGNIDPINISPLC